MKANHKSRLSNRGDEAVSPVIAVILMVAITVVLAATVYVWVSGLSTQETGPERASIRASAQDFDNDSAKDWMVLTLTEGANEPYSFSIVTIKMIESGQTKTVTSGGSNYTQALACLQPTNSSGSCGAGQGFVGSTTENWDVGESVYIACKGSGTHRISVEISNTVVLDNFALKCDEVG